MYIDYRGWIRIVGDHDCICLQYIHLCEKLTKLSFVFQISSIAQRLCSSDDRFLFQLGGMLRRLGSSEDESLHLAFVNDVIERFAMSNKWNRRQM